MLELVSYTIMFIILIWAALYISNLFTRTRSIERTTQKALVYFVVCAIVIGVVSLVRGLTDLSLENKTLGPIPQRDYSLEMYALSPDSRWLILNFSQAGFLVYDLEQGLREKLVIAGELLAEDAGRYDTYWKDKKGLFLKGSSSNKFYLLQLQSGNCALHQLTPQDHSMLQHHQVAQEVSGPGGITAESYYFPGIDYAQHSFEVPDRNYFVKIPAEQQFWQSSYKDLWRLSDLFRSDMEQTGSGGLFIQVFYRGLKVTRHGPKMDFPEILKPGLGHASISPDERHIFYRIGWLGPNLLGPGLSQLYCLNTETRRSARIDDKFCDYNPVLMLWSADSKKFIYLRNDNGNIELRAVIVPEAKKTKKSIRALLGKK
ncbi:hypothetical protein ACFL2I_08045 [Candidatus Omnitrophota bacterium]